MASACSLARVRDLIRINDLLVTVPLLTGAVWPKPPGQAALQPILVSLSIPYDISAAAFSDELSHTINYSLLCSQLRACLNEKTPPLSDLEELCTKVFDVLLLGADIPFLGEARVKLVQTRAPLNCKAIGIESVAKNASTSSWTPSYVKHFCEALECSTIIGVNPCEREERQIVRVNLAVEYEDSQSGIQRQDFRTLTRRLYEKIGQTSYQTLEALASYISEETLRHLRTCNPQVLPLVTVRAAKPSAIVFASSSEIEICRTYADFPETFNTKLKPKALPQALTPIHNVAIALGSNLGDRFYNIELALRLLEAPQSVTGFKDQDGLKASVVVVNTSFMYETAPMYVTDQPPFINCACMIETNLSAIEILKLLKLIEVAVGRVPSIRNGPRAIDLDIILYDDVVMDTRKSPRKELDDLEDELVVPHPRLAEREFVLRPLNDMIPDVMHPVLHRRISSLLAALDIPKDGTSMRTVVPFPQCPLPADCAFPYPSITAVPPTLTYWTSTSSNNLKAREPRGHKTRVMATLNATPDSFSDGATHNTVSDALAYAQDAASAGASILDVGGYSTRPRAAFVSIEDEISRVEPCIAAIRAACAELPISIDTFRPAVARAAIAAGANCINDVYAFTGQDSYPLRADRDVLSPALQCMAEMKALAREFSTPMILMHSRGDAGANKDYSAYEYAGAENAVLEGVRVELGAKVDMVVKGPGGVRRWLVIVDPGVGFSKTLEGNLQVLRDAAAVTADGYVGSGPIRARNPLAGYPQLIGASRKSFLGVILEQASGRTTEPKERQWATATAVACAVQQGAFLVRVHDTQEMGDVVHVANALW